MVFTAAHGEKAEKLLDAAIANSDSARVALRVGALSEKGLDPPVDEEVMDELLQESLSVTETQELAWKNRKIWIRGSHPHALSAHYCAMPRADRCCCLCVYVCAPSGR